MCISEYITAALDPECRPSSLSEMHIRDSWGYKVDIGVKDCLWVKRTHSGLALQSSALLHWKGWNAKTGYWRMDQNSATQDMFQKVTFLYSFLIARTISSPYSTDICCIHTHTPSPVKTCLYSDTFQVSGFRFTGTSLCSFQEELSGWAAQHLSRVGSQSEGCASQLHFNGRVD